jgi:opacity protein-like surface antigen
MYLKSVLAVLVVTCSLPLISQTVPDASIAGVPRWRAGVGVSSINPDIGGHGNLYGGTLWVEYVLNRIPAVLDGTSIELEARDVRLDRQKTQPVFQLDTAGVGPTYTFRRRSNLRPYVKANFGLANEDYYVGVTRRNQGRSLIAVGGGITVKAYRQVWVRADYEYQALPHFFKFANGSSAALNPQGFTVGAMYHLGHDAQH